MQRKNWTREETIIAFNVYCKIPFKDSKKTHPIIIEYANIIGRSPSALNMKIGNFGRLDPELKRRGITGLKNGGKLEEEIWAAFHGNWEKLSYESERLIAQFKEITIEENLGIKLETSFPEGLEKERLVKSRVNQSFFRSAVLSAYNSKCCITGISATALLNASHIIPWRTNAKERLNPQNGLCLNAFHDRAFDKGFIRITPDYKVALSESIYDFAEGETLSNFFLKYENKPIILPDKFLPKPEFLEYHYENIFIK